MEMLENREEWYNTYREGWLAHYQATGEKNFKEYYNIPRNSTPIPGPAVDLANSRLVLISTAGSYVSGQQQPFRAEDPFGDYSIRLYPSMTAFEALEIAHDNYDHSFILEDPQVLLPLRHLEDMVSEGIIGELAHAVISFSGYMPDATRVVDETFPKILEAAKNLGAQAALLVPS